MNQIGFELVPENIGIASTLDPTEDRETSSLAIDPGREWFMYVALRARPRCFGCGGRMLSKTVKIQANFALCERCERIDQSEFRPHWLALESLGAPDELTRSRGIVFWLPPITLPDQDAYCRWMKLLEAVRISPIPDSYLDTLLPRLDPSPSGQPTATPLEQP